MWIFPLLDDVMDETGLQEVETYISCRQNMAAQFIVTRPVMRPGPRISKWWWDQDGVDLEWIQMADQEAEGKDLYKEKDGTNTKTD